MRVVLQILGCLSIVAMAASVFFLIRGLRRSRLIRPGSLALEMAASIVLLWVYVALLRVVPQGRLSWPLMAAGLVCGALASRATVMTIDDGRVSGRRSFWYLVVWGASFAVTQVLALTASSGTVSWGMASLYLSTGLGLGMNFTLLLRQADLQASLRRPVGGTPAVAAAAPEEAAAATAADGQAEPMVICPGCGRSLGTSYLFCPGCGRTLAD